MTVYLILLNRWYYLAHSPRYTIRKYVVFKKFPRIRIDALWSTFLKRLFYWKNPGRDTYLQDKEPVREREQCFFFLFKSRKIQFWSSVYIKVSRTEQLPPSSFYLLCLDELLCQILTGPSKPTLLSWDLSCMGLGSTFI